jgi:hypothetical protein
MSIEVQIIKDLIKTPATWRAVLIDGQLWAYRREWPGGGGFDQWTPASLRHKWFGDVMQYFSPVQR